MNAAPRLDEDYHVHSTFSDDAVSTLAENLAAARERGLRTLCLAEHVRRGTAWVPEFLAAVHALRPVPGLEVLAGVEVKILARAGRLDLPGGTGGADLVVIECLIEATVGAMQVAGRPQLAHLFSILPKMGIDESAVPDRAIGHLARQAGTAGAQLEVNEKWACPSARTVRAFADAGVPLVASTDSHDCRAIGVYTSVRRITDGAFADLVP